jgi:nicotinamide mononucleotide (NMN) deamidase PncC
MRRLVIALTRVLNSLVDHNDSVSYGRSIQVGRFGHRGQPVGKVWFGWSEDVKKGETHEQVMKRLRARADEQEEIERRDYWLKQEGRD